MFGLLKLKHMLTRYNPQITTILHKDDLTPAEDYSTDQDRFMMAFALQDFTGEPRADPRYVKWVARHITQADADQSVEYIPLKECTGEDIDRFYQAEVNTSAAMHKLQDA